MQAWYDVGSKHDPDGRSGFAHLFEHIIGDGKLFLEELRKAPPEVEVIPAAALKLDAAALR